MSLKKIIELQDDGYEEFIAIYEAKNSVERLKYMFLHLAPGIIAFLFLYPFRESIVSFTGLSYLNYQFIVLFTMAVGWHIGYPFYVLIKKDGMSFKESLKYLGFHRLDVKGLFTILPVSILIFTIITAPFSYTIIPFLKNWLNSIPFLNMGEWHIFTLNYGFDVFSLPVLLIVLFANFVGEELYFRGFLLNKTRSVKGIVFINSFLFILYHFWQIPATWPYLSIFIFMPLAYLVVKRKNIYIAIIFHMFLNMGWEQFRSIIINLG